MEKWHMLTTHTTQLREHKLMGPKNNRKKYLALKKERNICDNEKTKQKRGDTNM
jgi:hypothetical protein